MQRKLPTLKALRCYMDTSKPHQHQKPSLKGEVAQRTGEVPPPKSLPPQRTAGGYSFKPHLPINKFPIPRTRGYASRPKSSIMELLPKSIGWYASKSGVVTKEDHGGNAVAAWAASSAFYGCASAESGGRSAHCNGRLYRSRAEYLLCLRTLLRFVRCKAGSSSRSSRFAAGMFCRLPLTTMRSAARPMCWKPCSVPPVRPRWMWTTVSALCGNYPATTQSSIATH